MEHRMILTSPCLTRVYAVMKARRKDAGVAQVAEKNVNSGSCSTTTQDSGNTSAGDTPLDEH